MEFELEIEWETIHLTTLAITAIAILYADHLGFQYMRGTRQYLDHSRTVLLHRIVWTGLIGMMISGLFLLMPQWEFLKDDPVFQLKMAFVAVLVLNAFAIGKLSKITSEQSFAGLPSHMKMVLLISGGLSFMGWVGAFIIGYFYL
jgi:hypothetical protein